MHKLLSNPGMRYQDLGADYYERRAQIRRQIAHHVGKLGALGFEVTLCRIPDTRTRRTRGQPGRLTHTAPADPGPPVTAKVRCRAPRLGLIFGSAVSYDDTAGNELEVTLISAPHHDPIVIGRSQAGDRCQITLERWLPIDGEPGIEHAVNTIHAILAASARPDPARIIDTAAEP